MLLVEFVLIFLLELGDGEEEKFGRELSYSINERIEVSGLSYKR